METTNHQRKSLLKLFIICAIGSSLFDISQFINPTSNTEVFQICQLTLKDLMYIGLSCLFFIQTPYDQLKLKTLGFMLISWRTVVLLFNLSNLYYPGVIAVIYAIYVLWLLRIYLIQAELIEYTNLEVLKKHTTYNIFIPVHSFRGLVQALFCFWRDPRYETTIFIHKEKMHYVKNQKFWYEKKDSKIIERLIQKTKAKVSIKYADKKEVGRINKLTGNKAITGLWDCRKLVIKGTT